MGLKKKNSNSFTLLEVLICVLILATAGSYIGLKVHTMIGEFRVKKTINAIERHIELCQKISLLQQHDVILILQKEKKGFSCMMGSEGNLGFYDKTKPIKQTFQNLEFRFPGKKDYVEFTFCSTGTVSPTGKITFRDSNKKIKEESIEIKHRYITHQNPPPIHPLTTKALKEKETKV